MAEISFTQYRGSDCASREIFILVPNHIAHKWSVLLKGNYRFEAECLPNNQVLFECTHSEKDEGDEGFSLASKTVENESGCVYDAVLWLVETATAKASLMGNNDDLIAGFSLEQSRLI